MNGAWSRSWRWSLLAGPLALVAGGYGVCMLPRGILPMKYTQANWTVGSRVFGMVVERGAVQVWSPSLAPPDWLRGWFDPKDAGNFSYGIMPPIGNRRPKWTNWPTPWTWMPRWDWPANDSYSFGVPSITLPFWLGGIPAAAGAWLVRHAARVKPGCCAACGYDLAGLAATSRCARSAALRPL